MNEEMMDEEELDGQDDYDAQMEDQDGTTKQGKQGSKKGRAGKGGKDGSQCSQNSGIRIGKRTSDQGSHFQNEFEENLEEEELLQARTTPPASPAIARVQPGVSIHLVVVESGAGGGSEGHVKRGIDVDWRCAYYCECELRFVPHLAWARAVLPTQQPLFQPPLQRARLAPLPVPCPARPVFLR